MLKQRVGLINGILVGGTSVMAVTTVIGGIIVYHSTAIMSSKMKRKGQQRSISENTNDDYMWYLKTLPTERKIVTNDGLTLYASYIAPEAPSCKAVILAHGIRHSHEQMIPYARLFHSWGYHVLMPDARAHGNSDGRVIGFGWSERNDYVKWIDSLVSEFGNSIDIVLFGISMGAASVLATAGETLPNNVKAVVADSGFSSVYKMAQYVIHHEYHLPSFPLLTIVDRFSQLMTGTRLLNQDIKQQLSKANVPILFIHGRQDTVVPFDNLASLLREVRSYAEVYIDDDAQHIMAYAQNASKYRSKLHFFLNQVLITD